jgi:hypothetical protein
MAFYDYEVDPWNSDLPCYIHLQSTYYGGTQLSFIVPSSPTYPHILAGTPSRYFLNTNFIIDVSALTGARPILLRDTTSSVTLTRVVGSPNTNQYRVVTDLTSHRRSCIEFHSGQAGHYIDYDMYTLGGVLIAQYAHETAVITGLLDGAHNPCEFLLPRGYTKYNTHILSLSINQFAPGGAYPNDEKWRESGSNDGEGVIFNCDLMTGGYLSGDVISINYGGSFAVGGHAIRCVIMRIDP